MMIAMRSTFAESFGRDLDSVVSGTPTNLTIWSAFDGSGISGDIDPIEEWTKRVKVYGGAVTTVGFKPWNHHVVGVGIGHDDASFAERGVSYAAYLENELPTPDAWVKAIRREIHRRFDEAWV